MEKCLAMAVVGFLQKLWEEPIWVGVCPYLDPVDSVCLRTAPMVWNVPSKHGPHGELFSSCFRRSRRRCWVVRPFFFFFLMTSGMKVTNSSQRRPTSRVFDAFNSNAEEKRKKEERDMVQR